MDTKLISALASTDDKAFIELVLTAHETWLRHSRKSAGDDRRSVLVVLHSFIALFSRRL
jgi:hypothetical protein